SIPAWPRDPMKREHGGALATAPAALAATAAVAPPAELLIAPRAVRRANRHEWLVFGRGLTVLAPADVGWDLALYARAWLDERAKVALEAAAKVAEEPGRGPVHDVRVACRRLREAIAFFRDLAELPPLTDVDRAARRMARAVRRLRETDVAVKRLS